VVTLDEACAVRFSNGNPVEQASVKPGLARVYGPNDKLLGIGEILPNKCLKPKRIMNL
jgi:hypothetical protein